MLRSLLLNVILTFKDDRGLRILLFVSLHALLKVHMILTGHLSGYARCICHLQQFVDDLQVFRFGVFVKFHVLSFDGLAEIS